MKQFFAIVLSSLLSLGASAQLNDSIPVSQPGWGNQPNIIQFEGVVTDGFNYWEDKFTGHWSGIYLGLNGFMDKDYSLYPEDEAGFLDVNFLRSTVLNLNLIQISQSLQHTRNTIGLVTGVGMEFQTYFLDKKTSIEQTPDRIEPIERLYDSKQKSKLSSFYLTVPLLVEFQIPVKHYGNRIHLSAGVVASKRLSTHTKVKYRENGKKEKLKTPDDFHMHDFRFSGQVRLGYRWINLYASYDLQPLFKEGKGPELYPFSVGVALLSF
ncbi:outer membrane beta-barrel protein [uncultured Sunxiuqinia sp.]|uniref:outer membrane beta-barrel protein n=1 Tax=Sunxiuqinia rutila TaxID=1397841 RepID=UPI002615640D|nr:outer membrane beta-barrel protein [uncultured Sunxiuqinia sp.]